jgi:ElaB/YqjD/DUF883 family membrane-anchored ribosome-binding protein
VAPNLGEDSSLDSGNGLKHKVTDKVGDVKDKVADLAPTNVKGKAEDAMLTAQLKVDDAKAKAGDLTTAAQVKALDAQDALVSAKDTVVAHVPTSVDEASRVIRENPALVGAGAFAIGALAGAFVPRTSVEKQKIAEVQGQVVDTVQEAVQTGVDKAKGAVEKGVEAAKEEITVDGTALEDEDEGMGVTTPNRITGSTGRSATDGSASRSNSTPEGSVF